jgi:hypothetical protein
MGVTQEENFVAAGPEDLWKGALAGLAGGLVASFVMNRFQELWTAAAVGPSRLRLHFEQGGQIKKSARHRFWTFEKSESATTKAANALSRVFLGRRLSRRARRRAGSALHYLFGGISGALYGAAVERFPSAARGRGAPFGAVIWLLADEIFVPATKLAKPPDEYPASAHAQSLAAHLVYGAATEAVRDRLRQTL